jgi:eukaryotic-like serine/threonine-protein kinase
MTTYAFGPFELTDTTYELRRGDERVHLERRAYDVLEYLIRHRERLVTSHELLAELWSRTTVTRGSITRVVRILRNALDDEAAEPRWIATAHGRGYRFVGTVHEKVLDTRPAAPVDARMQQKTLDPFVGRNVELLQLRGALERSLSGAGQACFIAGEPGIGKTRLCHEIAHIARGCGVQVLSAWCHDGEGAPSYWPWIQFLRTHTRDQSSAELRAVLGPGVDIVGRTVPELRTKLGAAARSPALSADEARFLFFDSVTRLFMQTSRRQPILLLLDDLHSADGPSLRLLEFFCSELAAAPVFLVAAHRNADIDLTEDVRKVLGRIARQHHCTRIELEGLNRGEVADLVGKILGKTLEASWIDEIHHRTAGNPFFARQIADSGASSGVVPTAVRDLLIGRVGQLPRAAREMLDAASIVSTEWPADLVRGISGLSLDTMSAMIDECLSAGLLRTVHAGTGRFGFLHALVRENLYAELSIARRRELHRRAMEWLEAEQTGADPSELAYHAYHSAMLDQGSKALEHSVHAAERATRRLAYEDAALHYSRAIEMLGLGRSSEPAERRCELLIGLGESRVRSGERSAARDAFRAAAALARELRSGALLARIALGLAPGLIALEIGPPDPELISLLNDSLELCMNAPEQRALLLGRLALAQTWSVPTSRLRPMVAEAVGLADTTG